MGLDDEREPLSMIPKLLVLLITLVLLTAPGGAQNADRVLVLDGATLIDGTGTAAVPDARVVIRGERILAAGARASVGVPDGAQLVDARGKWIIPGLVDAHVHF